MFDATPSASPFPHLPTLVAHGDWGSREAKQWLAIAVLQDGRYGVSSPERVRDASSLLRRLRDQARGGCVLAGFDFPIGVPLAYARQAGISRFTDVLPHFGQEGWTDFYALASCPEEIGVRRPFYPHPSKGSKRPNLVEMLEVPAFDHLLRACDRKTETRRAACPIFWTVGGNQVGRAAIAGWRDMLGPARRSGDPPVCLWPFDGPLAELLAPGRLVVAETYPTEFYGHLGIEFRGQSGRKSGKRQQHDRRANAPAILAWARENPVDLTPELSAEIDSGFGPRGDGEDPFDALVGLLGMLNVLLRRGDDIEPTDPDIRQVEGWILGQRPPAAGEEVLTALPSSRR